MKTFIAHLQIVGGRGAGGGLLLLLIDRLAGSFVLRSGLV